MTRWERQIKIKQFFDFDEDDHEAVRTANLAVLKILKAQPEYGGDDYAYTGIVDDWERAIGDAGETPNLDEINWALDDLYEWADHNLIWIGGDVPSSLPSVEP